MPPAEARAWSCPARTDLALRAAGHQYSVGVISTCLALVLDCHNSLRGAEAVVELFSHLLDGVGRAPSYVSVRRWLLRVGLYDLTRSKQQADDWIWIVDHTMQIGERKCLIIVGIRQSAWEAAEDRRLKHGDVELIDLQPVVTSTGEVVARQLQEAAKKTGVPREIVSDNGRDLRRGLDLFCQQHRSTRWLYDIKHNTASLLKRELQNDADWKSFVQEVNLTKQRTYLTPLAFLTPPQQRGKARYMNVDVLVEWAAKVLRFLDDPEAAARHDVAPESVEEKLGWLRAYRERVKQWQEMMAVIGVAEHYVRCQGIHRKAAAELRPQLEEVTGGPLSRQFRDRRLAWIEQQSTLTEGNERLLGSSEVLESIIGKYKNIQGEQSQHGLTPMILSIGAFVGRKTVSFVKQALEQTTSRKLLEWTKQHLGTTVHSHRKQAFTYPKTETKMAPETVPRV